MTLDSNLSFDVWMSIFDYLQLCDLPGLLCANKDLNALVNQEQVYEQFARKKFPPATLVSLQHYNHSWKLLLKDGNAENGMYSRKVMAISQWRHNNHNNGLFFYINALRSISWDRKTNEIIIEIEAFGNSDLRAARSTTIFRINPIPVPPRAIQLRPTRTERYPHNSPSHQLCRQYYAADDFRSGHSYKFTYNGSATIRGSDYECATFLRKQDFHQSLQNLFDLKLENCDFIPRSIDLTPSDVLAWPIEDNLPIPVQEAYKRREWGLVQPANVGRTLLSAYVNQKA